MNLPICPREGEILKAVEAGGWTDELRTHTLSCQVCADTALVAGFLREADAGTVSVPEAGLVWWKAQLRQRREATQRAMRPVVIAERVALAGAGAALLWSVSWLTGLNSALSVGMLAGIAVLLASAGSAYYLSVSRR